ncbi:Sphingosine kinase 1 [Dispira simplex]|nr:Sphingosine kinase 1 [Dispira simplex]
MPSHLLLHSGKVEFYSTSGVLQGLLSVDTDSIVFKDETRTRSLLTGRKIAAGSHPLVPIPLYSVFGVSLSPSPHVKIKSFADALPFLEISKSTHFTIYALYLQRGKKPQFEPWTFRCASSNEAKYWVDTLFAASRGARVEDTLSTQRFCILANPHGGTQKAPILFERVVKPMCALARVKVEFYETTHADFAYDFGQTIHAQRYTTIATLSGDGLLHQLINGIMSRMDWQEAIKVPLGILPGGTCNGLAKSLDMGSLESATLSLVKGRTHAMDIMALSRPDGSITYGHLNLLWGIMADIDIESEKLRWAGPLRMNLWGMVRWLQLRRYPGRLHLLPAEIDPATGQVVGATPVRSTLHSVPDRFKLPEMRFDEGNDSTAFSANILGQTILQDSDSSPNDPVSQFPASQLSTHQLPTAPKSNLSRRDRKSFAPTPGGRRSVYFNAKSLLPKPGGEFAPDVVFPVTAPLPAPWRMVNGPFINITATNVPWISHDYMASPFARLNDGAFDVVWCQDIPRGKVLQYLVDSVASVKQLNAGYYQHCKVRAIILEPLGGKGGSSASSPNVTPTLGSGSTNDQSIGESSRGTLISTTTATGNGDVGGGNSRFPTGQVQCTDDGKVLHPGSPEATTVTKGPNNNPTEVTIGEPLTTSDYIIAPKKSKGQNTLKRSKSLRVIGSRAWRMRLSFYGNGNEDNNKAKSANAPTSPPKDAPVDQGRKIFGYTRRVKSVAVNNDLASKLASGAVNEETAGALLGSPGAESSGEHTASFPTSPKPKSKNRWVKPLNFLLKPTSSASSPSTSESTDVTTLVALRSPAPENGKPTDSSLSSHPVGTSTVAATKEPLTLDTAPRRSSPDALASSRQRTLSSPSLRTTPPLSASSVPPRPVGVASLAKPSCDSLHSPTPPSTSLALEGGTQSPKSYSGILDIDGEEIPCGPVKLECIPGLITFVIPAWYSETKYIREYGNLQANAMCTPASQGLVTGRPVSTLSTGADQNSPAYLVTEGLPVTMGNQIEPIDPALDLATDTSRAPLSLSTSATLGEITAVDHNQGTRFRGASLPLSPPPTSPNKLSAFPAITRQQLRQQRLLKYAYGDPNTTPSELSRASSCTSLGSFAV